jgi:hypothetical protein
MCVTAMLQQSWIHPRFFLIFGASAILLAGTGPRNVPNSAGLKQAWLQAMYGMEPDSSHGFTAQNAAQNLKLSFGSSGTRLIHGNRSLTLRLRGYGPGVLSSAGNRVEYRRGLLTEWYVNEARGLEQGFTLSARPGKFRQRPTRNCAPDRRIAASDASRAE